MILNLVSTFFIFMKPCEVVRLLVNGAIASAETKRREIQGMESKQSEFKSIGRIKKRHPQLKPFVLLICQIMEPSKLSKPSKCYSPGKILQFLGSKRCVLCMGRLVEQQQEFSKCCCSSRQTLVQKPRTKQLNSPQP